MICNCIIYDYICFFKYNFINISIKIIFEDRGGGDGGVNVFLSLRVGLYNFCMFLIFVCVLSYIFIIGISFYLLVVYSGKGGGVMVYI